MSKSLDQSQFDAEDLYVGAEEVTTHEESVPLPWGCGTRKTAARWFTDAMDMIAIEAKDAPGKK